MMQIIENDYYPAVEEIKLSDGDSMPVRIKDSDVLLCRFKGEFYAFKNQCTHQARPLTNAKVRRGSVICPFHGAQFNLSDGASQSNLTNCSLTSYPVLVDKGMVMVQLPIKTSV